MAEQMASKVHKRFGNNHEYYIIKLKAGQTVEQAVANFKSDPNVEIAEPNYIIRAAAVPNDTDYGEQWGLNNTGQSVNGIPGTSGSDIGVESAWDRITNCNSVTVAILDTGVNYTHSDLSANIWNNAGETANGADSDGNGFIDDVRGWDFISNDNTPYPDAGHESHGTHVAGIVGARGNNSSGTTGVCWQVKLMPLRILDGSGTGLVSDLALAINYAVSNGAKVINLSLDSTGNSNAVSTAINNANANGVVIVTAAGNANLDVEITASYPCRNTQANIICVAALDQNFAKASFSSFGATSVDVGAPGRNIKSSYPGTVFPGTGWTSGSGWVETTCTVLGTANVPVLINPTTYCGSGNYANNLSNVIYKTFNLSGVQSASLVYTIFHNLSDDTLTASKRSTGGNPFAGGGTAVNFVNTKGGASTVSLSGDSPSNGTSFITYSHDLSACFTANCSIGLQLTTNASNVAKGAQIFSAQVETVSNASSGVGFKAGTSMATPHVAGLAAMLRAFNPNFNATDTVNAIKNSGTDVGALSGITSTGKVINARQALEYVNTPRNVTITVQ